jgi:hypothetical protein
MRASPISCTNGFSPPALRECACRRRPETVGSPVGAVGRRPISRPLRSERIALAVSPCGVARSAPASCVLRARAAFARPLRDERPALQASLRSPTRASRARPAPCYLSAGRAIPWCFRGALLLNLGSAPNYNARSVREKGRDRFLRLSSRKINLKATQLR